MILLELFEMSLIGNSLPVFFKMNASVSTCIKSCLSKSHAFGIYLFLRLVHVWKFKYASFRYIPNRYQSASNSNYHIILLVGQFAQLAKMLLWHDIMTFAQLGFHEFIQFDRRWLQLKSKYKGSWQHENIQFVLREKELSDSKHGCIMSRANACLYGEYITLKVSR